MYLKEPMLPHTEHTHPLEYWKLKNPCGHVCLLTCKYLAIPPSSVASEHLFSSATDVISPERNGTLLKRLKCFYSLIIVACCGATGVLTRDY